MRRLRLGTAVVLGTVGVFGAFRLMAHAAPAAPDTKGPRGAGGSKADSGRPKPIIFDPFATPFAVVEKKDKESDSCALPAHADDWKVEPLRPTPLAKDGAATRKAGGKAYDQTDDKTQKKTQDTSQDKIDPQANVQAAAQGDRTGETARKLGAGTKPFCVYRWKKPGLPTRADFQAIGATPDKPIIGGTPSAAKGELPKLPTSVWQPLQKIFAHQAHGIEPKHWGALLKRHVPAGTMPVRVAVVDATPFGLRALDRSLHGAVVSYVVGTLLCSDPRSAECAERVRPYLALPMTTVTDDDPKGGYWGSFFQLADALDTALGDWDPDAEHLVINLSLGWDPLKLDPKDANQERVLALLKKASCLGAITVAAAGNPTGSDGAIYPGRFEEEPAPTLDECRKLGVKVPKARRAAIETKKLEPPSGDIYSPLIHSVGAIDNQDQRLASNRRWGQPRLAALGLSVIVPGPKGTPYLPPFTGTSVSTPVVSGAAAAVWSLRPELTASEVMALVYKGGVALDGMEASKRAQTEFCTGQHYGCEQRPAVHRIYLCGAVAQALADRTPAEKVKCDPSLSQAFPVWPSVGVQKVAAKGPCRIANCGLPLGPVSDQMAAADVAPHGGFAACPGCSVTVVAGIPILSGIIIPPDDLDPGLIPDLGILIAGRYTYGNEFNVAPLPDWGVPMSVTGMTMPPKPEAALLTFSYWRGAVIERTDPQFSIPFQK